MREASHKVRFTVHFRSDFPDEDLYTKNQKHLEMFSL